MKAGRNHKNIGTVCAFLLLVCLSQKRNAFRGGFDMTTTYTAALAKQAWQHLKFHYIRALSLHNKAAECVSAITTQTYDALSLEINRKAPGANLLHSQSWLLDFELKFLEQDTLESAWENGKLNDLFVEGYINLQKQQTPWNTGWHGRSNSHQRMFIVDSSID